MKRTIKINITNDNLSVKIKYGHIKEGIYNFLNRYENTEAEITEINTNSETQLLAAELYAVENNCDVKYFENGKELSGTDAAWILNKEFIDIYDKLVDLNYYENVEEEKTNNAR